VIFTTTAVYPATEDGGTFAGYFKAFHGSAFWLTVIASPIVFITCEKTLRSKRASLTSSFIP